MNKFIIKNFRSFCSSGAHFELAPITILTGCNSSGKSSMIKALMLLNEYNDNIKLNCPNGFFDLDDYRLNRLDVINQRLNFVSKKHNLGRFDKVVNINESNTHLVEFEFIRYSSLLDEELRVKFFFTADKMDLLNNGKVHSIKVETLNGKCLYDIKSDLTNQLYIHGMDTLHVKNCFIDYLLASLYSYSAGEKSIYEYKQHENLIEFETSIEAQKQIIEKICDELKDYISSLKQNDSERYKRILDYAPELEKTGYYTSVDNEFTKYIRDAEDNDEYERLVNVKNNIMKIADYKSLFYISAMDDLYNCSKENIGIYLEKIVALANPSDVLKNNLYFIKTAFIISNFDNFADFLLDFEDREYKKNGEQSVESKAKIENIYGFESDVFSVYTFLGFLDRYKGFVPQKPIVDYNQISFSEIYDTLCNLAYLLDEDFERPHVSYENMFFAELKECDIFLLYQRFILQIWHEVVLDMPSYLSDVKFVSSDRVNVQRLYTYENQGSDFNELLVKFFYLINNYQIEEEKELKRIREGLQEEKESKYQPYEFTNKWIKKLDIGEEVCIKATEEGLGMLLYIKKNNEDRLLADEGYGVTQLVSLLLQIEVAILSKESTNYICIEEPEIHLHPKLQSKLSEMFLDAYKLHNLMFILETHSEYLVRKLQSLVVQEICMPEDVAINYVHSTNGCWSDKKPRVANIRIDNNGSLSEPMGEGFFDEADNLVMESIIANARKTK